MSIYGHLNCHDCRQTLWLGKAVNWGTDRLYYHIGQSDDPPHWRRERLNQVVWKFLAAHTGHRIDVRLEQDMTDEMDGYQDIGHDDDADAAISTDAYLAGWPGLTDSGQGLGI